ncbi:nucleotide-binding universal stress UspA family protein [Kribbella voronezhensis]|uniref:Nucleotide-binding universal stress UspA family protein n=1 Tax=Kribbella voronezhensis TaxID=2512212 RepID=A0A4R7SXX2_9ACTN|nr:universal stress protein [Kribbella voronezhensis]TDU83875.1 nucleotide-binding universal stress UspA family protein [Kribbella voronezhensis]
MTVSEIFVGVDASWRETGALDWALQEAALDNASLRAVHVIDEQIGTGLFHPPVQLDEAAAELVKNVQHYLDNSTSAVPREAESVIGPPDTTLAKIAAGSRMLVVGRRGMGTFQRLLIGSTSEAVAYQASVPVVVIPTGWKPVQLHAPVVVGLNDSGENDPAIDFAVRQAVARHVALRMVHAWVQPTDYGWSSSNIESVSEAWEESAERHFETIADQLQDTYPMLEITLEISRLHPVQALVESAEASGAQLIVVGGHNRHRLTGALLGAVVRGVLQHATCPVAVVHAPANQPTAS